MTQIYCILGPTASGKTALSLKLARELNGEIISVDSRQIYVGMDIGTAKEAPRPADSKPDWQNPFDIEGIPHYLIDICTPEQRYTAFDFKEQAAELISQILNRGKVPILAGGTGLYFDALLYDYESGEGETADPAVRAELEARLEEIGSEKLWEELNAVDNETAAKVHPNNPYYVLRALEYFKVTGKSKAAGGERSKQMVYDAKLIGIEWDRKELYDRINSRIDIQMENGLLDEVKRLREQYPHDLPSMTSIGYGELGRYLDGEISLEDALELFKRNTRRYAKRQLTWFRRYEEIEWRKASENSL